MGPPPTRREKRGAVTEEKKKGGNSEMEGGDYSTNEGKGKKKRDRVFPFPGNVRSQGPQGEKM